MRANTAMADLKNSVQVGESKEWRRFSKIIIKIEWQSTWRGPFWSMPRAYGCTLVWPSSSGQMQSIRQCLIIEDPWCFWTVGFLRRLEPPAYIWCISYVHIELSDSSKLELKSRRCIFIRYRINEYGYRFWDPENCKILRHKDVIFNEHTTYKDLQTGRSTLENDLGIAPRSTPD